MGLLVFIGSYSLSWVEENENADPQVYTDDAFTGTRVRNIHDRLLYFGYMYCLFVFANGKGLTHAFHLN